jgi:hypothetical protein
MSLELLTMRILDVLRPTSKEPRPELDQLATELRRILMVRSYKVREPQYKEDEAYESQVLSEVSSDRPTPRLSILFENAVETFSLLLQAESSGLVHRHVVGYMRGKKSLEPYEERVLNRILGILEQNNGPFPVLEIMWRWSWSRLPRLLLYPNEDNPIAVAFDKNVGRTSGPRSISRIVLLSRDSRCIHLLHVVRSVVPFNLLGLKGLSNVTVRRQ